MPGLVNISLSASYLGNGRLWDRDFGNAMTVDMPHFGNSFAFEAQQVIYSGGAINSGIRQAELGKLLAELDLQKNIQEIRFLLDGHYLDIYRLDNQIRVLEKNIELTDEVIADMVHRHRHKIQSLIPVQERQKAETGPSGCTRGSGTPPAGPGNCRKHDNKDT